MKPGWHGELGQGLHKNIMYQVRASKDIQQGMDVAETERPEVVKVTIKEIAIRMRAN